MKIKGPIMFLSHLVATFFVVASAGNFYQDFEITWGDSRAKILENGQSLSLTLDKASGSGFRSKNEYLFGKIDMQLKLVAGNSAGTVTAYYLSSLGSTHDEIDFEFLGNLSGDPYILHTNVFTQGKGNREQQFYLWFDPTKDFHTYSLLWNPQSIIFSVDGTPIREFKNLESKGVDYPKNQAMRIYSSLWNAENWATRGGLVKTDWAQAPFTATYRNFNAQACVWTSSGSSCSSNKSPSSSSSSQSWLRESLDSNGIAKIHWAQKRRPPDLSATSLHTPPYMEEQFILRVPPNVAERIERLLNENNASSSEDKSLDLQFGEDGRSSTFVIGDEHFPASLLDLPAVVESYKTYDDNSLVKTADIGQMIMVRESGDAAPDVIECRHGLTPPMRDARKRRFRREPDLNPELVSRVEKDLLKIIAGGTAENLDVEVAEQEGEENARSANKKPAATPASKHDVPETHTNAGDADRSDSDESDESV